MREILFRAKRTDNGEWVEGSLIHRTKFYGDPDNKYFILTDGEFDCDYYDAPQVDFDTVGEWTGLTDKNGEKIFDGDVVEGADFQADDGYAKIGWDDDSARFVILGYGIVCDFDNYYGYELEIIGNIYDNPDLIER